MFEGLYAECRSMGTQTASIYIYFWIIINVKTAGPICVHISCRNIALHRDPICMYVHRAIRARETVCCPFRQINGNIYATQSSDNRKKLNGDGDNSDGARTNDETYKTNSIVTYMINNVIDQYQAKFANMYSATPKLRIVTDL